MNLKKLSMLGITALSFGTVLAVTGTNASAATWHSSAIPSKLRGAWSGNGQKLYIYRHTIYYPGINKMTHIHWKYTGNQHYRFKGNLRENGLSGTFKSTTSLHYLNSHKITTMSMQHNFYR